jgi:hypothetical protein
MTSIPPTVLVAWLSKALVEEPRPDLLRLAWTPDGVAQETILDTVALDRKTNPDELGARIEQQATEHAIAWGQTTNYTIALSLGGRHLRARTHTVPRPAPADGGPIDGSLRTAAKMMAKHAHELQRINAAMFEVSTGMMATEVRQLRERVSELETGRLRVVETVEELLDRRAERELEAEASRNTERRKDRAFHVLEQAAPMIMARISGATPAARLMRTFSKEQRELLYSVASEEQVQILHELLQLAGAGEQAEAALTGRAGAAPPEPETPSPQEGATEPGQATPPEPEPKPEPEPTPPTKRKRGAHAA